MLNCFGKSIFHSNALVHHSVVRNFSVHSKNVQGGLVLYYDQRINANQFSCWMLKGTFSIDYFKPNKTISLKVFWC